VRSTFLLNRLHFLVFLFQHLRLRMIGINLFREIVKKSKNVYQFNPSTIFIGEQIFTVWREVDKIGTRQLFLRIDHPRNKESESYDLGKKIKAFNSSIKWIGDSRLFCRNGKLHLVFDTGHSETPNRIFIVELDKDELLINSVKEVIKLDARNTIEKNWNFFCEGEDLYAIYCHQPFIILKLEKESKDFLYFRTSITHPYKVSSSCKIMGEIRGTSTPILTGNVYISATHSSMTTRKGLVYYSHFFIFESAFPFLPVSFSTNPVNYGIASKVLRPRVKLNSGAHRVEFPSGVFKDGESLIIGFGLNDFKIGVKIMRLSRVLSQKNSIEI
jgi:hypothetical protein